MTNPSSETDLNKMRRAVIDLIAETRSRSIRVALFGSLIQRPDPDGLETEAERASQLKVLLDTVRWIERVAVLLETGTDPWNELPADLCKWTAEFVQECPDIKVQMRRMADQSSAVAQAAAAKPSDLGKALRAHYEVRRHGFMGLVTNFCDNMWTVIDDERDKAVASAADTGKAIQKALTRLEGIGKHVQLVSINASIEAARIGDAGLGVGVLAKEFRFLAEEIRGLAVTAKANIVELIGKTSAEAPK